MSAQVRVALLTGKFFTVETSLSITVSELRPKLVGDSGIPADRQRIIYAGRVLKDHDTLESCGFKSGDTLHVVRSATNQSSQQAAAEAQRARQQTAQTSPGLGSMGFGGLGGMGGMGAFGSPPDMASMQQQLMNNPEMMQQIMSSPMMQSLMSNPEIMRGMMQSNPQVRQMMDRHPEVAQLLNDPELMRQSMDMMRNPRLRDQMVRQHDRALSNAEAMPGGFNLLRSMYSDVQEPLMDAASSMGMPSTPQTPSAPSEPLPEGRNTAPLPNPWSPSSAPSPTTGAPASGSAENPFAALFGAGGTAASSTSASSSTTPTPSGGTAWPGGLGGLGGMGGMGGMGGFGAGITPEMQAASMRMMAENPQLMRSLMENNPMIRDNPMARAGIERMLNNPELVQRMADPANIRAMQQLQESMQQLQSAGLIGDIPGMGGMGGASGGDMAGLQQQMQQLFGAQAAAPSPATSQATTGSSTTATPDSSAAGPVPDFASLFRPPAPAAGTGTGTAPTGLPDFASLFSQPAPAAAPAMNPREQFASQIAQMREMGFTDEEAMIRALTATNGNMNLAVERLFQS